MNTEQFTFSFISSKDRVEVIMEKLGDKVSIKKHDDNYYKVTFENVGGLDMLSLFHAGISVGCKVLSRV